MPNEPERNAAILAAIKVAWPHAASFIGAVLSLSFVEKLTARGKIVAVTFGFFTATFIGPIGHAAMTHFAAFLPAQIVAPGLNFLTALAAMTIIPPALKAIGVRAGNPEWVDALIKKAPLQ
jgi:hypothetical protein